MKNLVTFKTAVLAKEKGYNIPCWDYVNVDGEQDEVMGYIGDTFEEKLRYAKEFVDYYLPTQSELQKWLRDVHNIHININWVSKRVGKGVHWYYTVKGIGFINNNLLEYKDIRLDSYEDALEEGLYEALKLLP